MIKNEWYEKNDNYKKYRKVKSNLIYGNSEMKFSEFAIAIPAYHRPEFLEEILDSALNQHYNKPYNIVVVDDYALEDKKTNNIMKKYCKKHSNIYYYKNEKNLGPFGNFNRIFEITNSNWICLLHDDDIILPNYLSTMNDINPNIEQVGVIFNSNGVSYDVDSGKSFSRKIVQKINCAIDKINRNRNSLITATYENSLFSPSCALYNKKVAIDTGGLNDEFYPGSDIAYWEKLNYLGYDLLKTRKLVSYYRFSKNDTLNITTQIKGFNFLIYFSKSYFNKIYKNKRRTKKLYSKDITRYYYQWIMNYPNSKDELTKTFKKINLEKKYYNSLYQKLIVLQLNFKTGFIKIFR